MTYLNCAAGEEEETRSNAPFRGVKQNPSMTYCCVGPMSLTSGGESQKMHAPHSSLTHDLT